jgi:hypothetical protein
VLSEAHYHQNRALLADFLKTSQSQGFQRVAAGDQLAAPSAHDLGTFNAATAEAFATALQAQIGRLVQANAEQSALSFTMDENL